jgi:hypothetical protein
LVDDGKSSIDMLILDILANLWLPVVGRLRGEKTHETDQQQGCDDGPSGQSRRSMNESVFGHFYDKTPANCGPLDPKPALRTRLLLHSAIESV